MVYNYNSFANKVFALPILLSGHSSLGITKDNFIKTVYQEAFDLLVFSHINKQSTTFNMVCIRLKDIERYAEILKSDLKFSETHKIFADTKSNFESKVEKRRQENKYFNEYWNVYMLGLESEYKKSLQR